MVAGVCSSCLLASPWPRSREKPGYTLQHLFPPRAKMRFTSSSRDPIPKVPCPPTTAPPAGDQVLSHRSHGMVQTLHHSIHKAQSTPAYEGVQSGDPVGAWAKAKMDFYWRQNVCGWEDAQHWIPRTESQMLQSLPDITDIYILYRGSRWLRSQECLWLLQKTQVQFPVQVGGLAAAFASDPRDQLLSSASAGTHTHVVSTHAKIIYT